MSRHKGWHGHRLLQEQIAGYPEDEEDNGQKLDAVGAGNAGGHPGSRIRDGRERDHPTGCVSPVEIGERTKRQDDADGDQA